MHPGLSAADACRLRHLCLQKRLEDGEAAVTETTRLKREVGELAQRLVDMQMEDVQRRDAVRPLCTGMHVKQTSRSKSHALPGACCVNQRGIVWAEDDGSRVQAGIGSCGPACLS